MFPIQDQLLITIAQREIIPELKMIQNAGIIKLFRDLIV